MLNFLGKRDFSDRLNGVLSTFTDCLTDLSNLRDEIQEGIKANTRTMERLSKENEEFSETSARINQIQINLGQLLGENKDNK